MAEVKEETVIRRIQALLAKAEATTFEEEAEAFFAKATELMDKYRIDEARVRPNQHNYRRHNYLLYKCKYLRSSLALLTAVARHYGVIVLVASTGNSKEPTLVGEASDIEAVEMMFGSLIIQRDRAALRSDVPYDMNKNKFFNSFAYGWAVKISQRLREIRRRQEAAARGEGDSTALVVFDRLAIVRREMGIGDSKVGHNRPTIDGGAAGAGSRAAETADLGGSRIGNRGPVALGR